MSKFRMPSLAEGTLGFIQRSSGVYTLGRWPKVVSITDEFLVCADPRWVQRSQGRVTFTLANTSAIYAVEYVPLANLWSGRLVEGTFA